MAKYSFDFNLEAWIQDVEIEADSYEEAENKLYDLIDKTIEDAMRNGYNPIDVMSQYADVKEVPKWEI